MILHHFKKRKSYCWCYDTIIVENHFLSMKRLCNVVFETIHKVIDHLMARPFISNQIHTHYKIDQALCASYAENVFMLPWCFRGSNTQLENILIL